MHRRDETESPIAGLGISRDSKEIRIMDALVELREEGDDKKPILEGYAAKFRSWTQIGGDMWGWMESVEEGAFRDSIRDDDIRALFNHDSNQVLGRKSNGTLSLSEDKKGLKVRIEPPDTSAARDVVELIRRGDVSGMSFGFQVKAEEWAEPKKKGELPKRTLKELTLFDVGPVTFPAYTTTSIKARDQVEAFLEAQERAERMLIEAAAQSRERELLLAEADTWRTMQ